MTSENATKLRKAFDEKARQLAALHDQQRALATPAALGDERATKQLESVNAAIAKAIAERDTLRIAIEEADRVDREAAAEADRKAEDRRRARAGQLGDRVIALDCRVVDTLAALRKLLDERHAAVEELNGLGVLHEATLVKLNNSTDLCDGIAEILSHELYSLLRANISPGAFSRIVDADCNILGKDIPEGRARKKNPLEQALTPRIGIREPGPAPVNRRPEVLDSRMRA